jgi:hypothetical protein
VSRFSKSSFRQLLVCLVLVLGSTYARAQDPNWETRYVVIAGESGIYDSLRLAAEDLAKRCHIRYDDQDQKWSKKKGLYWREDADDGIWNGEYYPRRYEEDLITLEMKDYYLDKQPEKPSMKMIIVAGIFETKLGADARLKLIKQYRPLAYIRAARLYMGCIH